MVKKHMAYILKLLIPFKSWLFTIIASFISFLLPLQPLMIVVSLLALLDYFIKLYCIYKLEGKAGIKSNRMQDTMYKIVLYAFFLFVLYTVDVLFIKTAFLDLIRLFVDDHTALFVGKAQLVIIGTVMIMIREVKSIDENWCTAFGVSFLNVIYDKFLWLFKLKKDDIKSAEDKSN